MIFFPLQAVHVLQVLQAVGRRSMAGGGAFCGPYRPRAVAAVLPVALQAVRRSVRVLWPLRACCVSGRVPASNRAAARGVAGLAVVLVGSCRRALLVISFPLQVLQADGRPLVLLSCRAVRDSGGRPARVGAFSASLRAFGASVAGYTAAGLSDAVRASCALCVASWPRLSILPVAILTGAA